MGSAGGRRQPSSHHTISQNPEACHSSVTMLGKPEGAVLLVSWEELCGFLCYRLGEAYSVCWPLQANTVARPSKQDAFVHD